MAYDGAVPALVAAWKERGLRRLAVLAGELVAETVPRLDVAALAFVPPDHDRNLRRGHHPAERLAREALFLLVFGSRPAIKAVLRSLVR